MLKTCWLAILVAREVRVCFGSDELKAACASLDVYDLTVSIRFDDAVYKARPWYFTHSSNILDAQ